MTRHHAHFRSLILTSLIAMVGCTVDDAEIAQSTSDREGPQIIALDTSSGYTVHQITGETFDVAADTLPSGEWLPFERLPYKSSGIETYTVNASSTSGQGLDDILTFETEQVQPYSIDTIRIGEDSTSTTVNILSADTLAVIHTKSTQAYYPDSRDNTTSNIRYLDVAHGLTSSRNRHVIEDKRGYIWIATYENGALRYDGRNFIRFNALNGFPAGTLRTVMEDKAGNIWFGADNSGLFKYDGQKFLHYHTETGLPGYSVMAMLEAQDSSIWVAFGATEGFGRIKDGKITTYAPENGLGNGYLWGLCEDEKGKIFAATYGGGLNIADGDEFVEIRFGDGGPGDNVVLDVLEDYQGNLWFAFSNYGLVKYDGETYTRYHFGEGSGFGRFWDLFEDSKGNIWVSSFGGGLASFDGHQFVRYSTSNGLSNDYIVSTYEDRSGNIWACSFGGGINIIRRNSFRYISEENGLTEDVILSIAEDKAGKVWLATYDKGLMTYDGSSFKSVNISHGPLNNITNMVRPDKYGNIWFSCDGGGALGRIAGEKLYDYTGVISPEIGRVLAIAFDEKNSAVIGGVGGLMFLDSANSFRATDKDKILNSLVNDIHQAKDGSWWIGTGQGLIHLKGDKYIRYAHREGLPGDDVGRIVEDDQGNMWLAHEGFGISVFDGERFTVYSEKQGLSSNQVMSLEKGKDGEMWVCTKRGISRFVPDDKKTIEGFRILNYTPFDGLKSSNFMVNSSLVDSRDRLWAGTTRGVTFLELDHIASYASHPNVQLDNIEIDEQFIDYRNFVDSTNSIVFNGVTPFTNCPEHLELDYDKNHLTFQFSSPDWSAPHKVEYSHSLSGSGEGWSNVSTETKAEYRNLSPGHYTFKVKSRGESGEWGETYEYQFIIHPPWWQTWWARALYVISGLLVISMIFRLRTRRLKQRQAELEHVVTVRTAEVVREKQEVERQKEIILEKNTEILDSINYARRLQDAILPAREELNELLKDGFVLFLPKDVVAGDFYWLKKSGDEILFAVADCTGHGVPGAMVSVVCKGALDRAVREFGISKPSDVLDKTREIVVETYAKGGDVKDGMDISLCGINFGSMTLNFSGANNPIYLVRGNDLTETKADKQPIGKFERETPFTNHAIPLQRGDMIYLFTDGLADQFGGPKGKKFKYKAMQDLLRSIRTLSMEEQKQAIQKAFTDWKGSLDQVDDICIMGVRI